jgi:lipid A ethanolaminephosphotransferase
VLPAWWLWQQPVRPARWTRRLAQNAVLLIGALVVAGLVLMLMFQDFASLMRNHKQVRYLNNPLNSVYAVARAAADTVPRSPCWPSAPTRRCSYEEPQPPGWVVVGEPRARPGWAATPRHHPNCARCKPRGSLSYHQRAFVWHQHPGIGAVHVFAPRQRSP